jgi:thioesterase domain-containing protein/acyl carrier protein
MPDGNIEFLGRVDNQVKLRGFRIELGEIEAVLCQYPPIREALAMVREDTPGMRSLVAYVTPKNQEPIPPVELRQYLGSKLPAYMVPSAFVILEALPLTPNGKVDRRALSAPDQRANLAETAVAPRTPTEKIMASLWANLFKGYRIGIHDNFFELGGDSLLAVRLLSEVNKEFDKKLSLAAVFQAPTIEQLANLVAYGGTLATWSSLYAIQPHGSKAPFFWIHGEDSDAFLARYLEPDQPLYGVRHQSEDGKTALHTTVPDIAEHYLSEIRAAQPHGPYFLGGYCFGGVVAFEMAHRLKRLNEDVRLLVMLDPDNPIVSHSRTHTAQNTSASLVSGTSLIDTVLRHTSKLYSLKPKEKARYIRQRAAEKIRGSAMRITGNKTMQRAAYRIYLALGYPIPPSFRSRYILDIYEKAMTNYVPEIYPGRLTVFRAADNTDAMAWKRLAGKGLDLHEMPGDHTAILTEPHVKQWAEILSIKIARAQIAT